MDGFSLSGNIFDCRCTKCRRYSSSRKPKSKRSTRSTRRTRAQVQRSWQESPKPAKRLKPSGLPITLLDSDDDEKSGGHIEKAKNKVDTFFKANNLLSDDEEEEDDLLKEDRYKCTSASNNHQANVKKHIYSLSDSEDDCTPAKISSKSTASASRNTSCHNAPGTSGVDRNLKNLSSTCTSASLSKSETKNSVVLGETIVLDDNIVLSNQDTSKSKQVAIKEDDDDIMKFVDSVLDGKTVEVVEDKEEDFDASKSLDDLMKETDEMLKSATALFDDCFKGRRKKETLAEETAKEVPVPQKEPETTPKKVLNCCPICLESLADKVIAATTCGHVFCRECIVMVAKQQKKCPTCRKAINTKKIHPIYI